MMGFLIVVDALLALLLVLVAAILPAHEMMSEFELKRRSEQGDKAAKKSLHREELLGDVLSLQRILVAFLLVVFVSFTVAIMGWIFGILVALIVALGYSAVAQFDPVRRFSTKQYERVESRLLQFIEKHRAWIKPVRSVKPTLQQTRLDSREELVHLITQSDDLLGYDEKSMMLHGLNFGDRVVSEIMTPRSVIDSIDEKELLGPLVLDDLHKTGHSRFPVTGGDVDHVVGMLYIQNLLTLGADKRSRSVREAMEPRVFYIREDQTLRSALAAFLRTHHHLFVVVNEYRETVGLLSLEDVVEALLGHKIVDEFDTHEDLRAVAERNPRKNNAPKRHENV